jgi:hypothetical protein
MPNTSNADSNSPHKQQRSLLLPKILLCLFGLFLFATNPWRDLYFYQSIAAHEGFGTTADTYIIGFAAQLLVTIVAFPVAMFLIIFGIGRAKRISALPRFDRFTWFWGVLATVAAVLMVWIEGEYVIYGFKHPYHWRTVIISILYIVFIDVWWCCSISHGYASGETGGMLSSPAN